MTVKMWAMLLLTGGGAELTSGLLMRLLRTTQHLSVSYSTADFLTEVRHTSGEHRIITVSLEGVFAAFSLYLLKRFTGTSGAEVTGAIWHKKSDLRPSPLSRNHFHNRCRNSCRSWSRSRFEGYGRQSQVRSLTGLICLMSRDIYSWPAGLAQVWRLPTMCPSEVRCFAAEVLLELRTGTWSPGKVSRSAFVLAGFLALVGVGMALYVLAYSRYGPLGLR